VIIEVEDDGAGHRHRRRAEPGGAEGFLGAEVALLLSEQERST